MNADFVAAQILKLAELKLNLIIVSPNPITYIVIPINELIRIIYLKLTKEIHK